MSTRQAYKRLSKEYQMIMAAPPPYITAAPREDNILEWHYVITGPPDTPYFGGQYHGTLVFPSEYPFKPPTIRMTTPNGRFQPNSRLCLSMSDHHPDTWNPSWSVSTILNGLLSFMTGDEETGGSILTNDEHKRYLAKQSREYNARWNVAFKEVFPDLVQENLEYLRKEAEEAKKLEEERAASVRTGVSTSFSAAGRGSVGLGATSIFAQEKPIPLDEITDPEDRIRALTHLQGRKDSAAGGTGMIWPAHWRPMLVMAALMLLLCCTY